jgi:hypothetical protein
MGRHLHFPNGQPRPVLACPEARVFLMLIIARRSVSRGKAEKMPLASRAILEKVVAATLSLSHSNARSS